MNDYLSWAVGKIIESAITDANEYGEARNVWVGATVDSDSTTLLFSVEDDGFDQPTDVKPGMGLDGIAALGGKWHLTRLSGGGCALQVRLTL